MAIIIMRNNTTQPIYFNFSRYLLDVLNIELTCNYAFKRKKKTPFVGYGRQLQE